MTENKSPVAVMGWGAASVPMRERLARAAHFKHHVELAIGQRDKAFCDALWEASPDTRTRWFAVVYAILDGMLTVSDATVGAYMSALESPVDERKEPWRRAKALKRWSAMIRAIREGK